jgi:hypothetical protein
LGVFGSLYNSIKIQVNLGLHSVLSAHVLLEGGSSQVVATFGAVDPALLAFLEVVTIAIHHSL